MLLFGIIEQVHFISIVSLLLIPPRGHIPQFPCFGVFPFASLPSPPKYLHIFNTYILMSSDIGIYLWYHDHNQGDKCMCHIYCICILFSCTTLLSKPMVKKSLPLLLISLTSLVAQMVRASGYNAGDPGSIPGLGRSPWRRQWHPTPVPLPGKSHGQKSLVGYSPWGRKESDTTERLHSV